MIWEVLKRTIEFFGGDFVLSVFLILSPFLCQVEDLCKRLEEKMHERFEQNNMYLQAKVQELTDVMQRISHLQEELRHVCKTLTTVYEDLGLQPEMS